MLKSRNILYLSIEPMHGVLFEAISVSPFAIVEPVGKPVSVFPVDCCGHAVLDCVWLVGQWSNTLSRRESVQRKERTPGRNLVAATELGDFRSGLLL
jgi:hypothetical protein